MELVRTVGRSFYEDRFVVFLEYLFHERMLPDDQLADRFHAMVKDVNRIGARLRDDRLVRVENRQEVRASDQKTYHRIYYYTDYALFVDAVKYKIHKMRMTIEERMTAADFEVKGYCCERCDAIYTVLDLKNLATDAAGEVYCERCHAKVHEVDRSSEQKRLLDQRSELMDAVNPILKLLKKIDVSKIPPFNPLEYLKQRDAMEILSNASSREDMADVRQTPSPSLTAQTKESSEILVEVYTEAPTSKSTYPVPHIQPLDRRCRSGTHTARSRASVWLQHAPPLPLLTRQPVQRL